MTFNDARHGLKVAGWLIRLMIQRLRVGASVWDTATETAPKRGNIAQLHAAIILYPREQPDWRGWANAATIAGQLEMLRWLDRQDPALHASIIQLVPGASHNCRAALCQWLFHQGDARKLESRLYRQSIIAWLEYRNYEMACHVACRGYEVMDPDDIDAVIVKAIRPTGNIRRADDHADTAVVVDLLNAYGTRAQSYDRYAAAAKTARNGALESLFRRMSPQAPLTASKLFGDTPRSLAETPVSES